KDSLDAAWERASAIQADPATPPTGRGKDRRNEVFSSTLADEDLIAMVRMALSRHRLDRPRPRIPFVADEPGPIRPPTDETERAEPKAITHDYMRETLARDSAKQAEEALLEFYKRLRPGDPPTVENARSLVRSLFFNFRRYDLGRVGRHKLNK